jgi:hypothetical protein
LEDLHGEPGRCNVIEGPASGGRAVIPSRDCCNTVSLTDVSYVAIRHLDLPGDGREVDAVKAEFPSVSNHHVLLEDLVITGHGATQATVGISTKSPVWNWVVRQNVIVGAGTGLYLGNSDGTQPFVNGLIEHNLVRDCIGYDMQIKHQLSRNTGIGTPASGITTIRHNVFSKASGASTGENARPNVLVGHFPLTGPGATDRYEIYGNLFHENPVEALFQGEGNVAFHDNLLVRTTPDPGFPALAVIPHNDVPRAVDVFHNTVVAHGRGIRATGGAAGFQQPVRGNASVADLPIDAALQDGNFDQSYASAGTALVAPFAAIGSGLDLYPRVGTLSGPAFDGSGLSVYRDWDRDFNGTPRDLTFRGGYHGEGTNPGWDLALAIKPVPSVPSPALAIADVSPTEGGGQAVFTVSLVPSSAAAVTASWATGASGTAAAGTDYTTSSGTLSFAAGETSKTITVPLLDDGLDEAGETFFVNLSGVAGATVADAQARSTIVDDDPLPTLTFVGGPLGDGDRLYTEGDTANVAATFQVRLSAASGRTVSVSFATGSSGTATSDTDYAQRTGTLTWSPGETQKSFVVQILPDTAEEIDEVFYVNLSAVVSGSILDTQSQCTITDNDPAPPGSPSVAIADATVLEGDTGTLNAVFTITLSGTSANTITVPYTTGTGGTATSGVDYVTKRGTLTFTPGQTTKTVNVQVTGDTLDEPNETFFVNLTSAAFATVADGQARGTITDQDP